MTHDQTSSVCSASGEGEEILLEATLAKPTTRQESTTHRSGRDGTKIDHIVVHYTTSRNIEGTISHFKSEMPPRTSAHYIVGRDGALVQMVPDDERAWHAGTSNMNARSIGIEHVAKLGDKITAEQSSTSIALIRFLINEYSIPAANIIPHVCVKSTDCCGDLFRDFGGGAGFSCAEQKQAVRKWLRANGVDLGAENAETLFRAEWADGALIPAQAFETANASPRLAMAKIIVNFEARRDARGRLAVYDLPPGDGGGRYEVAGINERYHKAECDELVDLIRRGGYDEAEARAAKFIANYTDQAGDWTQNAGIQFFLRDTIFNRGAGGAAWVLQKALGVSIDRDVGHETLDALRAAEARPRDLLDRMRVARESYERLRRDETSPFWRGLKNRWDKAKLAALTFMESPEGLAIAERLPVEAASLETMKGAIEAPVLLRDKRDADLIQRLEARRKQLAEQSGKSQQDGGSIEAAENLAVRASFIQNNDDFALERILGKSDLLPIQWLERGRAASRSVCRVVIRDQSRTTVGYGTGFMIAPNLMLTNNHVLSDPEAAQNSLTEFDFEEDIEGPQKPVSTFKIDPSLGFITSPMRNPGDPGAALDYTIVGIDPTPLRGKSLTDFGFLSLIEETGKAISGESVTIIQHPNGGLKKIAARENQIVDKFDQYILYVTDTEPGSSGSPVFNDQWIVVALHHAGVEANDPRLVGRPAGALPFAADSAGRRWIANEGIRISSIFADIRARAGAKEPGAMTVARGLNIAPGAEIAPQEKTGPGGDLPDDHEQRDECDCRVPFVVLDAYEQLADLPATEKYNNDDDGPGMAEASGDGIAFGPNARKTAVSSFSRQVLRDVMDRAGVSTLTISSTSRSPAEQARVMFENLQRFGVAHQKELYGPSGDRVIDAYVQAKHEGLNATAIKSKMTDAIIRVGPARVSRHAADPNVRNVFDVAPSSVSRREAFQQAVRAERRVAKFITPPSDPGYHIEILQS